jgi:PAS domain S-box-containing protein
MDDLATDEPAFVTTLSHAAADPFRLLIEAVKDYGIFMLDPAGNVTSWNPGAEKSKGYSAAEILGKHLSSFYSAEDIAVGKPAHALEVALEEGRFEEEALILRKGGEPFWAVVTITSIHDSFGQHVGFANVTRDITERKAAEEALRKSERLTRNLLEHLPHRILVKDRDSVMTFCNARYAADLGLTPAEIIGRTAFDFHPADLAAAYQADDREVMARGVVKDIEEPYRSPSQAGWVHTVKVPYRDEQGDIVGVLVVFEDITERKLLEENLRQAQRMEAIGLLAGGVAHDFNNLLGVISGYAEIAHKRLPGDDPLLEEVGQILKASERATGLTRQLLAFGRRQVLQPRTLDLNAIVSDLEKMLSRPLGEGIELTTTLAPGLGRVEADPGQIEQVLMNLVLNARDAMPEGGRIAIETRNVELAAGPVSGPPFPSGSPTGGFAMIAVSDTGEGMDAATQARVFEPYFTTKEPGKGTGLGLSTVHGIISQSGGVIRVQSEVGKGTTFQVFLPRLDETKAQPCEKAPAALKPGRETVLLVDDEPAFRELLQRVLESNGYGVLAAADGDAALALAAAHGGAIELLLTDMILPGMSGSAIAERLSKDRPDVKVLYISGYSQEALASKGMLGSGRAFLSKPFRLDAFLHRVRDLLDEAADRGCGPKG